MAFDFGSLAGRAVDAISSFTGGLFSANQAKKNRAFQERMYERQLQDNRENWRMEQEYNTPLNQKNRIIEAGLNPLLMYEGSLSNVSTGAPQGASAPHGDSAKSSFQTNFGQAMLQARMLKAQVENLEADSDKKTAEALLASQNTIKSREEAKGKSYENTYYLETWQLRKEATLAQNNLNKALADTEPYKRKEIEAKISEAQANISYVENEIENKSRLTQQEIKESENRIINANKETAAMVEKLDADARKAYADAYYAEVLARTANDPEYRKAYIDKMANEARKLLLEGNAQEIENGLNQWILDQRPEIGSNGYKWRKFLDTWVTPLTESVGKIFGGSATYSVGNRGKK